MRELAQTNLQLYDQLVVQGWSDADLARTRRAYELATDLFAGQLRPSGKTFVAHLVGTASALLVIGARPELVHAGLLHAAYTHGDFGDGRRGASEPKRRIARAVIGATVENLVDGYPRFPFASTTVTELLARADGIASTERDLVVIRLSNEVDEHTDLGTRVCDRGMDPIETDRQFGNMAVLAERIGEDLLADLIRRTAARERGAQVPAVLRSAAAHSRITAPRSYRLRFRVVVRRSRWAARLRRIPAVRRAYRTLRPER